MSKKTKAEKKICQTLARGFAFYEKAFETFVKLIDTTQMEVHPEQAEVLVVSTVYNALGDDGLLPFADKCRAYVNYLRGTIAGDKTHQQQAEDAHLPEDERRPDILPVFLEASDPLHVIVVENDPPYIPISLNTFSGKNVRTLVWDAERKVFA